VRFDRIELTNYRSFGPGTTVIKSPAQENIVALVGANNAGKSNLLSAVRLALGSGRRDAGDPSDFHHLDITQELRINLILRESLKRENIYRKTDLIQGFYFRAHRGERGAEKGQIKTENYCLDADGKTYRPAAALGKRSGPPDPDAEPVRFLPSPASRIVPCLGRVHFLSPSLHRAFDTSGYGILAQLLDLYGDDFRSEANTYKVPSSGEIVTRAAAFDRLAARMGEVLRTDKLAQIEQSLSGNLQAVLGPTAAGAEVTIALPTAEELLAEVLSLRVQDDAASPALSVDRLGDGYRSLLRLAILRTYADLAGDAKPAVFLVEEPEAYLNPHLRRYFAGTLRKLAELGNDVLVTTHDAAFVSLPDYATVMRIAKRGASSYAYRATAALDFSYEKLAQKLRRGGNAEAFFAAKAILCEGQDDVAAVRALLDRRGFDPDALNISVLDCGGRENLPDYVRLLDELHIDAFVVTDGDASKIKDNDSTAKNVAAVEAAAAGRMFRFTEDIETALGTKKRGRGENPAHLVSLIEALDIGHLPEGNEIAGCLAALDGFCRPASDASPQPAEPAGESGAVACSRRTRSARRIVPRPAGRPLGPPAGRAFNA
jgi:predicted ATPase